MKFFGGLKEVLPILFLLTSCYNPTDNDLVVELTNKQTLSQADPGVYSYVEVRDGESFITFQCISKRINLPLDVRAPTSLLSQICIGNECVKNNLGAVAEITLWNKDFKWLIEQDYVYCKGYIPEWLTFTGIPPNDTIDEIFPEEMVISVRYDIKAYWRTIPSDYRDYCLEVECDSDGCRCILWE